MTEDINTTTDAFSPPPAAEDPRPPMPKTWLLESILATTLCCFPFGVLAILSAAKVSSLYEMKQYEAALLESNRAKNWATAAAIVGISVLALYLLAMVLLGIFGYLHGTCFSVCPPR